jgi:FKBP-type peptidyl-prolyl cis-trans isomerase
VRSGPRSANEEKDKGRPAQEHREDSVDSDDSIDSIHRKREELAQNLRKVEEELAQKKKARQEAKARAAAAEEKRLADEKTQTDEAEAEEENIRYNECACGGIRIHVYIYCVFVCSEYIHA